MEKVSLNKLEFCVIDAFNQFKEAISTGTQVVAYSLLLSNVTFIPYVQAGPTGGNIVAGTGAINHSGLTTNINQLTSSLAIDWNSYNLNSSEIVNYIQPGSSSIALNRILGGSASQIHGQINANGQVVLVNPNGIFFGQTASVNVGGLIASGLDIDPVDFMNGNYVFKSIDGTTGAILNAGVLNASLGGSITLLGKQVKNEGLISANLGAVNLAAGKEAVVTFDNEGLVGIKVTQALLQDELGIDPAIINNGEITSENGKILLTASQSQDIFSRAVNSSGIEQATSVVVNEDGSFTLGAGADVVNTGSISVSSENTDAGQIVLLGENITSSGTIKADSLNANGGEIELHSTDTTSLTEQSETTALAQNNGQGGSIKILGNKVGLFDHSMVNASGATGGGEVLIGGDQQGINKHIRNAEFIYLGENTQIKTDALLNGNGGKLITFASDTARIYGDLYSRGGAETGNGGFIETSGLRSFDILKTPDITAINGLGGEWLIDPNNINIVSGGGSTNINNTSPFASSNDGALLGVNLITTALSGGGTVTITTSSLGTNAQLGNITFSTDLDYSGSANATLQLNANNNIDTNTRDIIASGSGALSLDFRANTNGSATGTGNIIINDSEISTNGGSFTASGVDFTSSRSNTNTNVINTSGGNVSLTMTGAVDINSEIFTEGGDFTVVGSSTFSNNDATGDIDVSPVGSFDSETGGSVDITSSGDIDLGTLIMASGDTASSGTIAVTSTAGDITLSRNLDSEWAELTTATFTAANHININAQVLDTNTADQDIINLNLIANNNANGTGDVNINLNVNTSGGTFDASGVVFDSTGTTVDTTVGTATPNSSHVDLNMTGAIFLGAITTENSTNSGDLNLSSGGIITGTSVLDINGTTRITAAANNVTLNNTSNDFNGDIRIISANDVTLEDTNTISLGNSEGVSTVGGFLNVTADDGITDNGTLNVTGISTFSVTTDDRDITLNNASSLFQGALNLSTVGNEGRGDILVNNNGATTLGNVTSRGALTINSQGNLAVNGAVLVSNNRGSDTTNSYLNFGLDNVTGRTFSLNNGGSLSTNTNSGETANIIIAGKDSGNTYNFNTGSSISFGGSGGTGSLVINGGAAADTFNIDINIPGTINAGAGADIINLNTAIANINDLRGDAGLDVLNASNNVNAWSISGLNQGAINSTGFQSIESLVGGTAADTLTGPNQTVTWTLDTIGGGNLSNGSDLLTTGFSAFENITGGSGDDTFTGAAIVGLSGLIDGGNGGGTDTINTSAVAADIVFRVGTGLPTTELNFINIEDIIANAGQANSLLATNSANSWDITALNTGSLNAMTFSGIQSLVGGSAVDTIAFNGGSVDGSIDAAGDNDIVDYSTTTGLVSISLASDAFNGVLNAETIRGNGAQSTLTGDNIANTWSVTDVNDGSVTNINGTISFENFNNITGGTSTDDFTFTVDGIIDGILNGGMGADTLVMSAVDSVDITLNTASLSAATKVTGIETITGNNNISTLTADNLNNNWVINAANGGTVSGITFIGFTDITGGTADDNFTFSGVGAISGQVDGGSNTPAGDTVNVAASTASSNVTLGATGFINIETITGNNSSSILTAEDLANTWNITGANSGNVAGMNFIGFANLVGGSANDDFVFSNAGSLTGLITGNGQSTQDTINYSAVSSVDVTIGTQFTGIEQVTGNATATLRGLNINNTWDITTADDGNVGGINFINFANLVGGTADDNFIIGINGSLSGTIDGGAHTTQDTVDGSAQGTFNVLLGASGYNNIERLIGNDNTSKLTATNILNNWSIDGVNDGSVAGVTFENFANLTGGSAADNFTFTNAGRVTGIIDGGIGTDSVNGSALTAFDVVLGTNMIDIETFTGNNMTSSFTATNQLNTWSISGANDGSVNGINFINFINITGGSAVDNFTFTNAGSISGVINGAGGLADTLDGSALTAFNVVLGTNIINVEQITGGNASSTLTASNNVNDWTIDGANDGNVAGVSFFDFANLTGGADDDNFVFYDGGSISGTVTGGTQTTNDVFDYRNVTTLNLNLTNFFANTNGIEQLLGNDSTSSNLTGQVGTSNWTVTGVNDGRYTNAADTVQFYNVHNLTGNTGADSFVFSGAGALSGLVNGAGGAADTYDASTITGPLQVVINQDVTNVETITGNNTDSILVGDNTGNTWLITDNNDGSVDGVTFIDFNNITGGNQDDSFTFNTGASIDGVLDGGAELFRDTVSVANIVGFTLDLSNPSTTFTDIELVIGDGFTTSIIGESIDNTWNITGLNDGSIVNSIGTLQFLDFVNLTGGTLNDDFVFSNTGRLSGQINGGTGVNTIDYSALVNVSVNLDASAVDGINNINTITGNDVDSTINSANQVNNWTVSNHNDGTVNGLNFVNFNALNGNAGVDTFDIQVAGSLGNQIAPDSDLVSVISGLGGDDVFNVSLDGSNNGSIKLDGGADNDTLNLIGNHVDYIETYTTNEAGGYERLDYTQTTNTMAVNYTGLETIQDDVVVADLIVNGSAADNIILLNNASGIGVGTGNVQIDALTTLNFSGKNNLAINGADGTNDLIDIRGDISLAGTLALNAETVTNSSASLITADTLLLDSVTNAGISGTELRTSINNLRLTSVIGDVFIEESNGVNISEMNTTGELVLRTLLGDVTDSANLVSTGNVNITSDNGSILLDNSNQLSGELSLDAQNGNITLSNSATFLNAVSTQNLVLNATGDINDVVGSIITAANSTTINAAGQNIVLDEVGHSFNDITITNAANVLMVDSATGGLSISNVSVSGDASFSSLGSLAVDTLTAGGTATLLTTGAILDTNGADTNVSASLLEVSSVSGIGAADSFETSVRTMDIQNTGSGVIDIVQTGTVDLVALKNTGSVGDITFLTDKDINFNPGSVDANKDVGQVFMTTQTGSFLGLGDADITNPDITAHSATFFGRAGTFGTFTRPITLNINVDGSVLIDTRASFDPQFVQPQPTDVNTTGIDFSALSAISAVAGEQLVEVESLGDIDPAIFTDLQNYSREETSIRMPRDQLFEDEL